MDPTALHDSIPLEPPQECLDGCLLATYFVVNSFCLNIDIDIDSDSESAEDEEDRYVGNDTLEELD